MEVSKRKEKMPQGLVGENRMPWSWFHFIYIFTEAKRRGMCWGQYGNIGMGHFNGKLGAYIGNINNKTITGVFYLMRDNNDNRATSFRDHSLTTRKHNAPFKPCHINHIFSPEFSKHLALQISYATIILRLYIFKIWLYWIL